jgi:hypothetical protein
MFRLRGNIRSLIGMSFRQKGWSKKSKTMAILGCSFSELEAHLIVTAINNYGYWSDTESYHIDHIKPIATTLTEDELIALSHYSNLQFLYPPDNISKSDCVDWDISKVKKLRKTP